MRPFLFLLLLMPMASFAVDCTEADLLNFPTTPIPNPCDNLYVDADVTIDKNGALPDPAVVINVTGEVIINADINLDGDAGANIAAGVDPATGAVGGPGAGNGGGRNFAPQNGDDGAVFPAPASTSNGNAPNNATNVCGNGGSGGGLFTAGSDGSQCTGGSATLATGGTTYSAAVDSTLFNLVNFRGGYGGGAGDQSFDNTDESSSGGGGGGGLYINAGENITINTGATISARGGAGGPGLIDAGGGGGGSGGAIWLQSTGTITNYGTINVSGGVGGTSILNGTGGAGGNGVYRLESSTGTITGSGVLLPSAPPAAPGAAAQNYTSDISCGTIAAKNEKENLAQMFIAFGLVAIVGFFIRKSSRRSVA